MMASRTAPPAMTNVARRFAAATLAGFVLFASLVGPAHAILPLVPIAGTVIEGVIVRGVVGGVVTRTAMAVTTNMARQIGTVGGATLIGSAAVAFCGTGSVLDPCKADMYSWLKSKANPGAGEGNASHVPSTKETQSPTQQETGTWRITRHSSCGGGFWEASGTRAAAAQSLCNSQAPAYGSVCVDSRYTGTASNITGSGGLVYSCEIRFNGSVQTTLNNITASLVSSTTENVCPSGWTLNGSTCERQVCPAGYTFNFQTGDCAPNAGVYAPDGQASVYNNDGTWTADPLDPDVPQSIPQGTQTVLGKTPDGNPAQVKVTPNPDGSITVQTIAQVPNTGGNTQTIQNMFTINPAGQVTNAVTNYYNASSSTVINQQPSTPDIKFPEDYAREATQDKVRVAVEALKQDHDQANTEAQTKSQQINTETGKQATDYYNPDKLGLPPKESSPYKSSDAQGPVDQLRDGLSNGTESCVTYPMTLPHFGTININPCPLLEVLRPVMNWGFIGLCVITCFFIVLGHRPEEIA